MTSLSLLAGRTVVALLLIEFLLSCDCMCIVSFPHGVKGWYMTFDYRISWSYSHPFRSATETRNCTATLDISGILCCIFFIFHTMKNS